MICLRDDIRESISLLGCNTLNDMNNKAREWEIDVEHLGKRKTEHIQTVVGQAKRPKTQGSRLRGHQGRGCYAKCEMSHEGCCWKT